MSIRNLAAGQGAGLRFLSETASSGRFATTAVPAPAAAGSDGTPPADAAEIAALRKEVELLRAEGAPLRAIVDSDRRDSDRQQDVAGRTSGTLRRPARGARVIAIGGADQVVAFPRLDAPPRGNARPRGDALQRPDASPRPDAPSVAANSGPDWQRTDEALACLLSALARHADSEREPLENRGAAPPLRVSQAIARAERERAAIKRYRRARGWTNCWWNRVLRMAGLRRAVERHRPAQALPTCRGRKRDA